MAVTAREYLLGSSALRSQLAGVSDKDWTAFVQVLTLDENRRVRAVSSISESGGYGCFDLRPRRLADLGFMSNLRVERNASGRQVYVGDFVRPMTAAKFLGSSLIQYNALVESLRRYDRQISESKLPNGLTRSGALAVLHRMGPNGLKTWTERKLNHTVALVERANGKF